MEASPESPASPGGRIPTAAERRKVLGASFVGTAIEWYDFFIYGAAAALIFGPQFFPTEDPLAGTLAAFATFAVGFIARPIGGLLTGHFGDRLGRKKMLLLTMLVMGGATVAIGLLPNYAAIGFWAPLLLVVFRFLQGLGVGGEWGGAVLMAVEYAPRRQRAFYGSFPQMGLPVGIIVSNLVFIAVTATLAPDAFRSWGWRVPFLFSAVLIVVALYLRLRVEDSPVFEAARDSAAVERFPLGTLFRRHWKPVVLAGLASVAPPAIGYLYSVYMLSYGTRVLGIPQPTMLWLIVGGAVIHLVTVLMGALLADRYAQKPVFAAGAAVVVLSAFPFFWLVNTGRGELILLAFGLVLLGQSLMAGPQAALIAELFPTNVRYSGTSVAYQIGAIAGGGFAPLIATSLYAQYGSSTPISVYVMALGALSLGAILMLRVGGYDASSESTAAVPDRARR